MNTYLSSKSSFTSPQPLAAASGLTIPLQITLSGIKLSAFIILVFSRQKGLTLVFRNDPLESLKVSSTFDSIPFVRDYLQKEIEIQLRTLIMDELPAIIHRLSLRLWCKDYVSKEHTDTELEEHHEKKVVVNPFASLPQDAVDSRGNYMDSSEIFSLSPDVSSETQLLFSQKNLLRLAVLSESHKTLSLFTPALRDVVFRAWASPSDRSDIMGPLIPANLCLLRSYSSVGSTNSGYTYNRTSEDGQNSHSPCPSISSSPQTTGLGLGSTRIARSHLRKKKTRIVNLRKPKTSDDHHESDHNEAIPLNDTSELLFLNTEAEDKIVTPPQSPHRVRFQSRRIDVTETPHFESCCQIQDASTVYNEQPIEKISVAVTCPKIQDEKAQPEICHSEPSSIKLLDFAPYLAKMGSKPNHKGENINKPSRILEQAWILKMAGELAWFANDPEMRKRSWLPTDRNEAPPAYESKVV